MRQQGERFDLKSFCDTSHLQIEQLCPLKHLAHRFSFMFRTLVGSGPCKSNCIYDTYSMNENVLKNICHPFKDTQRPWREHYNFSTRLYYISLISHPTKARLERTDSSWEGIKWHIFQSSNTVSYIYSAKHWKFPYSS